MITAPYVEEALHVHLEGDAFAIHYRDNVLLGTRTDGGVYVESECQVSVDAYDPVPGPKSDKIIELKAEGLRRIQIVFPTIADFDWLDLVKEQYLSVAPAARQPTTDFQLLIDTAIAGRSAKDDVNAMTDRDDIIAYDVVNTPSWP